MTKQRVAERMVDEEGDDERRRHEMIGE